MPDNSIRPNALIRKYFVVKNNPAGRRAVKRTHGRVQTQACPLAAAPNQSFAGGGRTSMFA